MHLGRENVVHLVVGHDAASGKSPSLVIAQRRSVLFACGREVERSIRKCPACNRICKESPVGSVIRKTPFSSLSASVGSATKPLSLSFRMLIYLRSIEQPSYFLKSLRPESILGRGFYGIAMASTARSRACLQKLSRSVSLANYFRCSVSKRRRA